MLLSALSLLCSCVSPPSRSAEAELITWLATGSDTNLIRSLKYLPPDIREHYRSIADRGEKFNAGCVSEPGVPNVRFIAAGQKGDVLQVATEHGGAVWSWQIDVFKLDASGGTVRLLGTK